VAEDPHERFDPRFDPAFQRGYRPKVGDAMRVERRPAPQPKQPDEPRQAEAPPAPPVPPARVTQVVPREPTIAPGTEQASTGQGGAGEWGDDDATGDTRVPAAPSRNPYILTLWIVGIGFVVLGLALYVVSTMSGLSPSSSGDDPFQILLHQLGWVFATPLVTVGLATIIGLLFMAATRPRAAH
jgi:hypothetical protein